MQNKKKLCEDDILHKQNLRSIIDDGRFRIAIFWSARIQPGEGLYEEITQLAKNLTMSGYDIVTWGGAGAMEAASLGHSLASKDIPKWQAIGINIILPHEQMTNKYLNFSETSSTFSSRLDTFMLLSHLFVITPGGIGTLLELFYTWQLMQVGHICKSPIILWWKEFRELKKYLKEQVMKKGFINEREYELAIQVENQEQVLQLIEMAHNNYENGGKNTCVNITQYMAGAKALGLC